MLTRTHILTPFNLRISLGQRSKLERLAKKGKVNVSVIIRQAIDNHLYQIEENMKREAVK